MGRKSTHQKRLGNRAIPPGMPPQAGNGQCCDNHLLFAMKDNHHEFTMGVKTILECLLIAERQGAAPELPDAWRHRVVSHYGLSYPEI